MLWFSRACAWKKLVNSLIKKHSSESHMHLDATIDVYIRLTCLNYKEIGITKKRKIIAGEYVTVHADEDSGNNTSLSMSRAEPPEVKAIIYPTYKCLKKRN